ncbi:MAG TPA: DUF1080 domain-containing protein [Gemmatimonadaceae bacterium]
MLPAGSRRAMVAGVALTILGGGCMTNSPSSDSGGAGATTAVAAGDWRSLFDGQTTAGWRGYRKTSVPDGWQIVDGALVRAADGAGHIITVDKFRDFELALEWKVAPGGNSGIFYRATEDGDDIWQSAPEMQVLDDERHPDGRSPVTSAGATFGLHPVPSGISRPAGEWNAVRILVQGNHVEHWLNDVKVVEYELGSPEWEKLVRESKFGREPLYGRATEGHIGLQDHDDHVEFRNIRIRVLP